MLVAEVLPRETTDADGISVPSSGNVFGGLISRPESPISGIFSTASLVSNRSNQSGYNYSTQSLARRRRSPSVTRNPQAPDGADSVISDIHHQLGVSVNALMKHFLTDQTFAGGGASLTPLLCGENGLVSILEHVFALGRKKDLYNYFQRLYPWDYIGMHAIE